jgi:hypothetical protein
LQPKGARHCSALAFLEVNQRLSRMAFFWNSDKKIAMCAMAVIELPKGWEGSPTALFCPNFSPFPAAGIFFVLLN